MIKNTITSTISLVKKDVFLVQETFVDGDELCSNFFISFENKLSLNLFEFNDIIKKTNNLDIKYKDKHVIYSWGSGTAVLVSNNNVVYESSSVRFSENNEDYFFDLTISDIRIIALAVSVLNPKIEINHITQDSA